MVQSRRADDSTPFESRGQLGLYPSKRRPGHFSDKESKFFFSLPAALYRLADLAKECRQSEMAKKKEQIDTKQNEIYAIVKPTTRKFTIAPKQ